MTQAPAFAAVDVAAQRREVVEVVDEGNVLLPCQLDQPVVDAGQVNVSIGICPVKPAEFVVFSIGQWDGGALIED